MALSQEVLDNLAFANQMGFDKMHLAPPAQTREMMKHAPPLQHNTNSEQALKKNGQINAFASIYPSLYQVP